MTDLGVVARFLTFDYERNGGPSPPDFTERFDREEAHARTVALNDYLENFIAENAKSTEVRIEDLEKNSLAISRSSGEKLLVSCYGNDIFVLIRFPGQHEIEREACLFHEWANDLDTDLMITLVRRFVLNGHFHDDSIVR